MAKTEIQILFEQAIQSYRKTKTKSALTRSRNKKPIGWKYPLNCEKEYYNKISPIFKSVGKLALQLVSDKYNDWLRDQKVDSKNIQNQSVNWVMDSVADDLQSILDELEQSFEEYFGVELTGSEIGTILVGIAILGDDTNNKYWKKITKDLLGTPFTTDESWKPDAIDLWKQQNYNLITSLSEEHIKKLNLAVEQALENGDDLAAMKREIRKINKNISDKRVQLLARDQVGKYNSMLTKKRMSEVGLYAYIWNTAADERVRGNPAGQYPNAKPSHYAMQDKICTWADNTVYADRSDISNSNILWKSRTGKMSFSTPGAEIQCRCTALAFVETFLYDIDSNL